jgi:uncharacterized membrane protein YozB (DUF420 family)
MLNILVSLLIAVVGSAFFAWVGLSVYFRDAKKAWAIILPTMQAVSLGLFFMVLGVGGAALLASKVAEPNIGAMLIAMINWLVYSVIWIVRVVPSKAYPVPEGQWFPKLGWLDILFLSIYFISVFKVWWG